MPDRIDDRELKLVAVDGVVERVPADLVGRLENPADSYLVGRARQRWEEIPLDLRILAESILTTKTRRH